MKIRMVVSHSTSGMRSILIPIYIAVLSASVNPHLVFAQSPTLEQVERFTSLGKTEEARVVLLEWWENDRIEASRREQQRGLWLRGRLTVDPVQAGLDFQRLALLYPSGQFTPDAVLRLAQAAWAMGDKDAALRHLDTLERDYPRSEALETAREWIAGAGPLPPQGDTPIPSGQLAEPFDDTGSSTIPSSEEAVDEGPEADELTAVADDIAPVDSLVMNYQVQLGAFADRDRAVALYNQVRAQGVDARIVRVEGSQFTHVRAGRFADRSAAIDLLESLAEQGIRAALVRDERAERPAGI